MSKSLLIDGGGSIRWITVLVLSLFLIGCDSEFDKCMNTELPRAETLAGLEAEREVGRQLVSMRSLFQATDAVYEGMNVWGEENSRPSGYPEYPKYPKYECSGLGIGSEWEECYSAHNQLVEDYEKLKEEYEAALETWRATPEAVAWVNLQDEESQRLSRENGLPDVDTFEEYSELEGKLLEQMDTVLEPRSPVYQCYLDHECDEYGDENEYAEVVEVTFKEAILNNANTISKLVENSKELATVTCNNNGFYE